MYCFILCLGLMVCWVMNEVGGLIGLWDRVLWVEVENEFCLREKLGIVVIV